jgi:hypothetical protein
VALLREAARRCRMHARITAVPRSATGNRTARVVVEVDAIGATLSLLMMFGQEPTQ